MRRNFLPGRRPKLPVWGRVKTACIAALLACNVLLLAVLGCVKGYDAYVAHRTRAHMDTLFAARGILCGSSVYSALEDCPAVYSVQADSAVQEALARALLTGAVTSGAEPGNTMVWTGENGRVSWASSGELEAQVGLYSQPEPDSAAQAQRLLRRVLAEAGIEVPDTWMQTEPLGAGSADSGYAITVRQRLAGTQVLGCELRAVLEPGNELTLTGTWITGAPARMQVRALETYSAEQALLQLLQAQVPFAQLISAQPVYVLSDKSGGRFTTIPCWRFSTDSGDYVLNILSGDVVASADLEAAAGAEPTATLPEDEEDTEDGQTEPQDGDVDAETEQTDGVEQDIPWDEQA